MSDKTIYTIPGWGFSADLFDVLACPDYHIKKLGYLTTQPLTFLEITTQLAQTLPNDASVLGWSFGGLIAINIALLFPEKVKNLILIASQPKLLADQNWLGIKQEDGENFLKGFQVNPEKAAKRFIQLVNYPNRENNHLLQQYFLAKNLPELLALLPILFKIDLRSEYQHLQANIYHLISQQDYVVKQTVDQLHALNAAIKTFTLNDSHAGFVNNPGTYQHIIKKVLC